MIRIDVPQIAYKTWILEYKTWILEYRIYDKDGNRISLMEQEAEQNLERVLSNYNYSTEHDHVG